MGLYLPGAGLPERQIIASATDDLSDACAAQLAGVGASAVYPAANLAQFVPFYLTGRRTYTKAWWLNGTVVAGNVDVGIYTLSGTTMTRVVASTAEAQAGTSAIQIAATFSSTTIGPGLFYLAISCTSATATFWRSVPNAITNRVMGVFQAATSSPLPATPTVVASTQSFMAMFGISELSTI